MGRARPRRRRPAGLAGSPGRAVRGHRADRAVQLLHGRRVHRVDAVDQRGRARVGGPGGRLFRIRQGERAQGEDLVDLGAVVQFARAFRRDLRVVGQDDRRGQHDLAAALRAGQHRPAARVLARGDLRARPLRRVGHREERPAGHRDDQVGGDQGGGQRLLPARGCLARGYPARRRRRIRSLPARSAGRPATGRAAGSRAPTRIPVSGSRRRADARAGHVSASSPPGTVNRLSVPSPSSASLGTVTVTSRSTASSQTAGTLCPRPARPGRLCPVRACPRRHRRFAAAAPAGSGR